MKWRCQIKIIHPGRYPLGIQNSEIKDTIIWRRSVRNNTNPKGFHIDNDGNIQTVTEAQNNQNQEIKEVVNVHIGNC